MLDKKMELAMGNSVDMYAQLLIPFAGPGILGCHALPSQGVQSANHI
jgi:hypothetical protein